MAKIIDREEFLSRKKKKILMARFGLKSESQEQRETAKIDVYARRLKLANRLNITLALFIAALLLSVGVVYGIK